MGMPAQEGCISIWIPRSSMSADRSGGHPILESLSRAVVSWIEQGKGGPLIRWVSRELDSEGVPLRLAIPQWHECLRILAETKRRGQSWPAGCEARITGLIVATLRFARPDG